MNWARCKVGRVADISVLDDRRGRWVLEDNEGTQVITDRMLAPLFCVRDGVRYDANASAVAACASGVNPTRLSSRGKR